jgi:predicted transposase YdaD
MLSDPETLASFCRDLLPPSLANACQWDQLSTDFRSFADSALTRFEADIVCRVTVGASDLGIVILLEHQSSEDPLIAARVYSYKARV